MVKETNKEQWSTREYRQENGYHQQHLEGYGEEVYWNLVQVVTMEER